ncbi:TPA: hypothetical protein ACKP8B_002532 [Serratia marcescens]|nr:hypothetical protein [Serratia marcescens]
MYRACAWLIIFICSPVGAAIFEGVAFSGWYLTGANNHVIDYHLGSISLEPSDANGGLISCSGYGCKLEVRGTTTNAGYISVSKAITPATSKPTDYSIEEFNRRLRLVMPWSGALIFNGGFGPAQNGCISLVISTGFKETLLGSTCDGRLPPITKPPSVPLFCKVSAFSDSTIDFGMLSQGSDVSKSINAALTCEGDKTAIGQARLLFTDINRSGAGQAILHNPQNGQEIKAQLELGYEGGNEKLLTVKAGFNTNYALFVRLNASALSGKVGYFSGSALLIFEVL